MAIKKEIDIIVNKDKAEKSLKSVDDSVKKVDETSSKLTSTLDGLTGGAISGFKNLKKGLGTAINGFNSLKVAIIGTGIGALIIGILALKQAFESSEEGQNKMAKILGVIGSVTGNLLDLLSDLGEKIIWVFENPKKAITDFAKLIQDNIVNRFVGILEFVPKIGEALKQVFSGDFKGAAKTATDATGKILLGVKSITDETNNAKKALSDYTKELVNDAKIAGQIANQRAKADKIDRDLIVQRAEANRKRAELLEKSQNRQLFNTKERISFLQEASKIEEEITNKEIESARIKREALIQENTLSKSNKEALEAEEQAKAKVIELETQRLSKQKELTGQISGLIEQEKALNKSAFEERKRQIEEEQKLKEEAIQNEIENEIKRQDAINLIRDEYRQKLFDLEQETELQKLEREEAKAILELEKLNATEQQKYEVKKYYADLIAEEQNRIFEEFETQEQQREIDAEDRRLKEAFDRIQLEEQVSDAKKNIANQTLGLITEIAGRGSKIGKAIAVAQTIRSGIEGVQNAYTTAQKSPITTIFPAYPIVQAGLAGAFSAVQVKKILSSQDVGGGASSVSGGGNSEPTQSAPSFNLVQGTQSNQIAESVNANANRPVEAYVVSASVTTAQEGDRNRIEESSI